MKKPPQFIYRPSTLPNQLCEEKVKQIELMLASFLVKKAIQKTSKY